jgi:hypothetical protein
MTKIKHFFKELIYIKAFFSPFIRPRLRFYLGKIAIGTPYFYPRKWIENKEKSGYLKAVPRKFGFDFVGLGWKTKWSDTDYRFEWSPRMSFVFFKWQFAVIIEAKEEDQYWESWLFYEFNTDKSKSKKERAKQMREENPKIWIKYKGDEQVKIDYYEIILKKRYRNI